MVRPQAVVLPILRAALPGVTVVSWVPDVDYRKYPMVSIRRTGGVRNPDASRIPAMNDLAVSAAGMIEAEELYEDALDALYDAARSQVLVFGAGHIQSMQESAGPAQTDSPADTFAVSGSVRVAIRV